MGIFFLFAAGMALIAGITLLFTGAYSRLFPLRAVIGPLFLLLSALLIATAIGWFRRRQWGWTCALIIMALQLLGVREHTRGRICKRSPRNRSRYRVIVLLAPAFHEARLLVARVGYA
jgi:glycerol-3-phosphate acyltransferase PlsY